MGNLNKYIKQYLNHSYTINDGYIITEDLLTINTIAEDISLYYNISKEQAIQYILKWLKEIFGEYIVKCEDSDGYWDERTYDNNANQLTFKSSYGFWSEWTYNSMGDELTFKSSNGYWYERTYNSMGNQLTYKDSTGSWKEWTYDSNGNQLTYKNAKSK